MTHLIDIILLTAILFLSIILVFATDYMKTTIVGALISVIAATTYLVMFAPDVALTEAAVGACVSTCILLVGIRLLYSDINLFSARQISISGILCLIMFVIICYYSTDLHAYGDPEAIIHDGVSAHYIANIQNDIGMKSLVTAILASYRGMDTLCETLVVFTAGISVFFMFGYTIFNKK